MVLPGGFAHGDYLRPGAIARFSPVMEAVSRFAADGGPVVGICNGFQVLTEAGLLPGALQKNRGLHFLCATVGVRVESLDTRCSPPACATGTELVIPINHFEGNYTCDGHPGRAARRRPGRAPLRRQPQRLGGRHRRQCATPSGNVVGLMPHPERASDPLLGSADGTVLLRALLGSVEPAPTAQPRGLRDPIPGPGRR